ncbi:MAG: fibrobacter succinogenes major paralogous domain-containing protein [Fibrobacter sp.]|uniref:fibrobacter succinogenes major paralogous domain-containing protein n=1 Tax=Fibrobacter sp. TaxID=35828 RepID=UPI0025C24948|nr:fibrobacter succinogenes major paralogous domain-containing protein [Fibrobacter sp.]MBR4785614.1 fibrobacter succinogenes major paralogous domain-containing protein [Fibrobacter sp.]
MNIVKRRLFEGLLLAVAGMLFACNREEPFERQAPLRVREIPREQVQPAEPETKVDSTPVDTPMVYRERTEQTEKPPVDTVVEPPADTASAAGTLVAEEPVATTYSSSLRARHRPSVIVVSSSSVEPPPPVYCENVPAGSLCDKRDGQLYRLVTIGGQVWMGQNLNYRSEGSWCYDNKNENCNVFGRLYTWTAAMALPANYARESAASKLRGEHQGVCPDGYHMPTSAEMKALTDFMKKSNKYEKEKIGTLLKMKFSWTHSDEWPDGTDRYGFGAMAGGFKNAKGDFKEMGKDADFWVAEESKAPTHAPYWNLYYDNDAFLGDYSKNKQYAYSVRCLKNRKKNH